MMRSSYVWSIGAVSIALGCSGTVEDTPPGGVSTGGNSAGGTGGANGAGGSGAKVSSGGAGAIGMTTGGSGGSGSGTGGSGIGNGGASGAVGGGSGVGAAGGAMGAGGATGGAGGRGGVGGSAGSAGALAGSGGTSGSAGSAGAGARGGTGGKAGSGGSAGKSGSGGSAGTPAGDPATIGGCAMFTADDAWNQDISGEDVDTDWTSRLQAMVGDVNIHPDFGGDASELYGIPINVVPENQKLLPITFDWWPEESDDGPYPFPDPANALIEGGTPESCDGDCHLLVVQQGSCQLYEGYACYYDTSWHCGNGAHWDLTKNSYGQRPKGWTSADVAGLAITPGLLRYDEVQAGEVKHAIRFTTACSLPSFVKPATHDGVPDGCDPNDPNSPPMGLRVRLKADYDCSQLPASAQVVLTAMKKYGMILADNGSNFYFQGEAHLGWSDDDVISPLKSVPASAFEVVSVPPLEN